MQTAQHLGEVLRCTQEAMSNVLGLLKCSCANDSQMAMLTRFHYHANPLLTPTGNRNQNLQLFAITYIG